MWPDVDCDTNIMFLVKIGKHEKCIDLVHKVKQCILAVIKSNLADISLRTCFKKAKIAKIAFSEFSLRSAQSVNSMLAFSCAL